MSNTDTFTRLRERLSALTPTILDIDDESAQHAGHAGARSGGGHYRLLIVADAFAGLNTVARHRLVYQHVGDLMQRDIHALALRALTPQEHASQPPTQAKEYF